MQAARETGALKEAKDKLEKRVEELTWRLEFEKHLRVYFTLKCQKSVNIRRVIVLSCNKNQIRFFCLTKAPLNLEMNTAHQQI